MLTKLIVPLISGSAFVPVTLSTIYNPDRLLELMSRHKVSIAFFTPSFSIIKPLEEEKTNAALNFLKIWNRYCKTQPKYDGKVKFDPRRIVSVISKS